MKRADMESLNVLLTDAWEDGSYVGSRAVNLVAKELGLYSGVGSYANEEQKVLFGSWKDNETLHGVMRAITKGVVLMDSTTGRIGCSGFILRSRNGWHVPQSVEKHYTLDIFERDDSGIILYRGLPARGGATVLDLPDVGLETILSMARTMDSSESAMPPERWSNVKQWLSRWVPDYLEM